MGILDETGNQDPENITTPLNDAERWVIATYAIWSEYYFEDGWRYIAGCRVKEKNASEMRLILSRDWGINNEAELLDTVLYLTALYEDEEDPDPEDIETGAWDLCRACQILGMAFIGGLIGREEMMSISLTVCRLMQYYYPSWLHLYSSYLDGYREWRLEDDDDEEYEDDEDEDYEYYEDDDEDYEDDDEDDEDDIEALKAVAEREKICRRLLTMPDGPCSVPWNMELPVDYDKEDK